MTLLKNVFIVIFVVVSVSAAVPKTTNFNRQEAEPQKWWQSASFYQIYPRSFKDSDGDGVGDLKGITDNLAYLKEIGITATWISPIFKSPMADFGYDVSNFTDIDPIFGTMEDFDALVAKAKQVGVKIILDFVPNHSSDECEWFQKSIKRDPEFENFYVWHPGKLVNGVRQPPTNWVSVFRGSAWQWNNVRQEYYLHQFVDKQPDFNYRNPKVREYMNDVLRFWLKRGVSGFRVDAVPHAFEVAPDANGNYLDEPRQDWITDPDDYDYVSHIYTVDQPETIHLAFEWRKVLDDFQIENGGEDRILMIEAFSPIDVIMKYHGNDTADGAHIPFNFFLITTLNRDSNAYNYAETINTWIDKLPNGRISNWVMGNHDRKRIGTRMGIDRIDMLNMLLLTLPGCSVTYQGEEIGMTDVWISWADTIDPQGCNSNPSIYENLTRDPCRTPFQWNGENNSGFTTGAKTWLPVSDTYPLINVERERDIAYSHLNIYKQLQAVRNGRTFSEGNADIKAVNQNVLAVKRSLVNDLTYVVLLNLMDDVETINLNTAFSDIPVEMEYIVVTDRSLRRKGDITNADQIVLLPKEAVVLRAATKSSASSFFAFSLSIFLVISCISLLL